MVDTPARNSEPLPPVICCTVQTYKIMMRKTKGKSKKSCKGKKMSKSYGSKTRKARKK